jgi:exodeoxyribonuclease VII small subunit
MAEEHFEVALNRLEGLVRELEDGELPLEASLGRFEEGIALVRSLRGRLDAARLRVEVLQDDGSLREAPDLVPAQGPQRT